jgi:hypothetical protein
MCSKTPSFAGSVDVFASKCHFRCHDQGWQVKKGQNQHEAKMIDDPILTPNGITMHLDRLQGTVGEGF